MRAAAAQYAKSRRRLHSWWPPRPPWTAPPSSIALVWMVLVLLQLQLHAASSSITCGPGIKTAGVTVPRGDIVLEHGTGTPLVITCVLDPDHEKVRRPGAPASHRIVFYKDNERMADRYVTVINGTAGQLRVPDPPAGRAMFSCMLLDEPPRRGAGGRGDDDDDDADVDGGRAAASTLHSTALPTSLETSGPPPLAATEPSVMVCMNIVNVGYKPLPINQTTFSCISDNWISLTCNWTKPENAIDTEYNVCFRLPGRAGGRNCFKCPTDSDKNDNTCYWDLSTDPFYRQPYEYYYFTLFGENVLGNSSTLIRFHHYANVIPSSPINITVEDKTQSSAMLRWSVDKMAAFPRELVHKIEYKSQWDTNPEHWHSVNVSDICNSSLTSNHTAAASPGAANFNCRERGTSYYHFNVTNLKYPFALYDFRIYVRSSMARGDDKWSAPGCITLKTKPSIPRRPPRTDIGSFECVASQVDKSIRDIFIYWQNIEDNEKCGDSFEYRAFYTSLSPDNRTTFHRSNETYKNYAKFEGLSTAVGYNFTVHSANREGLSTEYSTIYVPGDKDKLDEPLSFTKMAFDEQGVFELSWKNASYQWSSSNQLNDYTIFWCESDRDRPYQCNGYMNWKHIPSTESCYNVTVSDHTKIYQFAISANTKTTSNNYSVNSFYQPTPSSSGMVWASCTVLHNKIVGKIKNVWVNAIGSTSMELRWKLDCSDRIGSVLGFRFSYCPVMSISNSACKEPTLNKTVSGEMAQDSRGIANITHLKPYTTYKVTIALITKHGEGVHSDPLLNTTLEGAPDVRDLKIDVSDLTNTSVSLSWTRPEFVNGIVRYYYVHYYLDDSLARRQDSTMMDTSDEQQQTINEPRRITLHETRCHIDHLESYRRYKITVTACTTLCSKKSYPIQIQTSIGVPGEISQPIVLYENSTRIIVSWKRPAKPAGPVDYYQLLLYAHHSGSTNTQIANGDPSAPLALASTHVQKNSNSVFYQSDTNVFRVDAPDCNNEDEKGQQMFSFFVRAVNNNPNDPQNPFYGPWSTPGLFSCLLPGLPLALHLVIWSCLFIVLSSVFTYIGNRFWKKYKVMHNVKVILPPTLNIKFDHFNDDSDDVLDVKRNYYVEDGHIIYDGAPAEGIVLNSANIVPLIKGRNNGGSDSDKLSQSQFAVPSPSLSVPVPTSSGGNSAAAKAKSDDEDPPRPTEPVLPFFTLPDTPPLPSLSTMPSRPSTASAANVVVPPLPPALPAPRISMPVLAPVLPTFNRGYQQHLHNLRGHGYQQHHLGGGVVTVVNGGGGGGLNMCGGGVVVAPVTIDCYVGDQQPTTDEDDEDGGGGGGDEGVQHGGDEGVQHGGDEGGQHVDDDEGQHDDDDDDEGQYSDDDDEGQYSDDDEGQHDDDDEGQYGDGDDAEEEVQMQHGDGAEEVLQHRDDGDSAATPSADDRLSFELPPSYTVESVHDVIIIQEDEPYRPFILPPPSNFDDHPQQPAQTEHPQVQTEVPPQEQTEVPPQVQTEQPPQVQTEVPPQEQTEQPPQVQTEQPPPQVQTEQPPPQVQTEQPPPQVQTEQPPQVQQPVETQQPSRQQPPPQQRNRNGNDGYCGKHMMIAVAAAAAAAAGGANDPEQQQQQQQLLSPAANGVVVPVSSTTAAAAAYVLIDMINAQKRLLDKTAVNQQPSPPPPPPSSAAPSADAVGCGSAVAQHAADANVEVTTT